MRSPLLPIFLTVFVDVLGLTLVLPLLSFYAEHFGGTPIQVGALTGCYAACMFISGPVLGRISDRVGRKPTLLASQLGTFVGFLILGGAKSLWMLFLGRIIDGMTAGNLSIAQAYISDVTKPENRTKAFAFIGIAFGTGFTIGPFVSGELAGRFGYGAPAYAAAALSATSVLCTLFLLPSRPPSAEPTEGPAGRRSLAFGKYLSRPGPRRALLRFFLFSVSFSALTGGLGLYLERRFGFDVKHTGRIFAFSGVVGALVQGGLIGRLAKKFGEEKLAVMAFSTMAIGYGLLGAAYVVPVLLALVVIGGFGAAIGRPSLTTLLTKSVSRNEQGGALGVSQSLGSIAQMVGPVASCWLIQHGLLSGYGLLCGGFAAAGILVGLLVPQPEESPEAASASS